MSDYIEETGFTGMVQRGRGQLESGECEYLENLFTMDAARPSPLIPRPGIYHRQEFTDSSNADVQALVECFFGSTTRTLVAVVEGELWSKTLGYTPGAWTKMVTTANLTTATVTLSGATQVHVVEYDNQLVFADNTNQPFMWDGTSGATGITKLSNAPATTIGAPTVYYGKLFFIKSGTTIVWSEEYAANTGYEATGYNNAWELSQTGDEPLTAILGTNTALYFWRTNAIGYITGAVTVDFTSTGTNDGISTTVGAGSAWSIAYDGATVFFADRNRRPWALRGRTLVPIWEQVPLLWQDQEIPHDTAGGYLAALKIAWANWPWSRTAIHRAMNHVLFLLPATMTSATYTSPYPGIPNYLGALVFDTRTLRCQGVWTWGTSFNCVGEATYAGSTGEQYHAGLALGTRGTPASVSYLTIEGMKLGLRDDHTGTAAYPRVRLVTRPLGYSNRQIKNCDELGIVLHAPMYATNYASVAARVFTPDKPTDATAAAPTAQTITKTTSTTNVVTEERLACGLSQSGRWFKADVAVTALSTGPASTALTKTAICGVDLRVVTPVTEHARR